MRILILFILSYCLLPLQNNAQEDEMKKMMVANGCFEPEYPSVFTFRYRYEYIDSLPYYPHIQKWSKPGLITFNSYDSVNYNTIVSFLKSTNLKIIDWGIIITDTSTEYIDSNQSARIVFDKILCDTNIDFLTLYMPNLKTLYFENLNMTNLRGLYLNCPIKELPENFVNLSKLYELYFYHCNFDTIPKKIFLLPNLEQLHFYCFDTITFHLDSKSEFTNSKLFDLNFKACSFVRITDQILILPKQLEAIYLGIEVSDFQYIDISLPWLKRRKLEKTGKLYHYYKGSDSRQYITIQVYWRIGWFENWRIE